MSHSHNTSVNFIEIKRAKFSFQPSPVFKKLEKLVEFLKRDCGNESANAFRLVLSTLEKEPEFEVLVRNPLGWFRIQSFTFEQLTQARNWHLNKAAADKAKAEADEKAKADAAAKQSAKQNTRSQSSSSANSSNTAGTRFSFSSTFSPAFDALAKHYGIKTDGKNTAFRDADYPERNWENFVSAFEKAKKAFAAETKRMQAEFRRKAFSGEF